MSTSTPSPKVTSRKFSWDQLTRRLWGKDWNREETAYRFSNDRTFLSTDRSESGIYKRS